MKKRNEANLKKIGHDRGRFDFYSLSYKKTKIKFSDLDLMRTIDKNKWLKELVVERYLIDEITSKEKEKDDYKFLLNNL